MKTKYLLIGGGPAGIAAAEAIRARDDVSPITLIDAEGERLYSKINLHRFLDGTIAKDGLYLRSESFFLEKKINLIKDRAISGDASNKVIELSGGEKISFEKLIIATGGRARLLDIKGTDEIDLKTFYSLSSTVALKDNLRGAQNILVIGGGFLTLDLLDGLMALGKKITLLMRDERMLQNKIGKAGSSLMEERLKEKNVEIIRNEEAVEFQNSGTGKTAILKSGRKISFDLAVVAIGLEVDLELAKSLGLEVGKGIIVDSHFESSKKDIYACGDVCQYEDILSHEFGMAGNWYFAMESGKTAGANAAGEARENSASIIVAKNIFGLNLYFSGSINPAFENREYEGAGKYLQVFIKDGKIVGLGALNMAPEIATFGKLLGQPFDDKLLPKLK